MGSPNAQKGDSLRLEVVCAVIQEEIKENVKIEKDKKPGDYTIVENKGRKDNLEYQVSQSLEQVIQAGAINNECGYDSKTNSMIRIVNGNEMVVRDKNTFKDAYKKIKGNGKTYIKDSNKITDYNIEEK